VPAITQLHQIDLHRGRITKPQWSPDGRSLALPTESGYIAIFDIASGQISQTIGPHAAAVTAVTWDRKSEFILSGSLDRSVGLWEVSTGRRAPLALDGHKEPVHSVEWTDEEAFAMTCSADRVRAYDGCCLITGWTEEMENLVNTYTGFTSASCSYQTTFLLGLVAENGSRLVLASLISGTLLDSVTMRSPIRCIGWSPAEELLAVGTANGVLLYRATQTGFEGEPREVSNDASGVCAVAFSSDGSFLVSHDAEGLKVWEPSSGKLVAALPERSEVTSGLAFHPSEPLLAAVTPNGSEFRVLDLSIAA
jgi:WD40 repeat protein